MTIKALHILTLVFIIPRLSVTLINSWLESALLHLLHKLSLSLFIQLLFLIPNTIDLTLIKSFWIYCLSFLPFFLINSGISGHQKWFKCAFWVFLLFCYNWLPFLDLADPFDLSGLWILVELFMSFSTHYTVFVIELFHCFSLFT